MKILVIHNTYQQTGGEDAVVGAEERLLTEGGHTIIRYRRGNDELRKAQPLRLAQAGIETMWSSESNRRLANIIDQERPDIAHFHNTFPLISPAAYYACQNAGVPVIQTLHNYRLLCPASTFFRDGLVCESCLGRSIPWPGVVHGCYHDSRATTSAISGMITLHRLLQTWKTKVDIYIALSEFARKQFVEGGLPEDRIVVKHNFVAGNPMLKVGDGEYALYVGRLTEEKGIRALLGSWNILAAEVPLKIAGDGPMQQDMISEIGRLGIRDVEVLGRVSPIEIPRLMQGARFLVFPSTCFENFPLAIAEAYGCGLPVIVSRLGAMPEIVIDGKTGLHFAPGDASDLAAKVRWAWAHPEEMNEMGRAARAEYEAKYTADRNCQKLMDIYRRAIGERKPPVPLKTNCKSSTRTSSGALRETVRRLGRPIHKKLRGQKLDLFFHFIGNRPRSNLLDVGGGTGMDSEFVPLYRSFENVTIANLTPPQSNLCLLDNVRHEIADGCRLPYPSKSFDWVFSNAVIEHVGSEERQRQFASEIRRVSKYGYFVTTPNKRFPIEPHSLLPFYQFLSESWQRRLARFSPYYLESYEDIRLLYADQLRELFPEAKIRSVGFPMIGTSLLAMYRDPEYA